MIRVRRGHRPATLSLLRRSIAAESGLSRGRVIAMGGFVMFLLALVVALQAANIMPGLHKSSTAGVLAGSATTSTGAASAPHAIKNPVRIVIPAIGVDAQMVHVGTRSNGAMDLPPSGLAAWYKLGVAPGAVGAAVIIGHVDSRKKADVFHKLKDLKPGDLIIVFDKSGDYAEFAADNSELVLKKNLPTDRIWNHPAEPVLRLITCGGKWDASIGHYLSNLIVYCHLVK
jgi:sortase (surface protein transpeptidase)